MSEELNWWGYQYVWNGGIAGLVSCKESCNTHLFGVVNSWVFEGLTKG